MATRKATKSPQQERSELVTKIENSTGFSRSHIANVLSGRRNNEKIASLAKKFNKRSR